MNTETIINNATRCAEAHRRGYEQGVEDCREGSSNNAHLFGEYPGETVVDILGDIIDEAVMEWEYSKEGGDGSAQYFYDLACYEGDISSELCEHYENGYITAQKDMS